MNMVYNRPIFFFLLIALFVVSCRQLSVTVDAPLNDAEPLQILAQNNRGTARGGLPNKVYLPIQFKEPATPTPAPTPIPPPTVVGTDPTREMRGLWVSRFDWTDGINPADPKKIDEIVKNAATAGFNAIFFQVRGTADAYYKPGLEPWAQRISGQELGDPPPFEWDPLSYFIQKAHQNGLQLHAYVNIYPVWDCGTVPKVNSSPKHLYYMLKEYHGIAKFTGTNIEFLDGLQWGDSRTTQCLGGYQRGTPGSIYLDTHILAVVHHLMFNYSLDGVHLDHIRYGNETASSDPVSVCRYNGLEENCLKPPAFQMTNEYRDWQRQQVNGTVSKFYEKVIGSRPNWWLTAAVWPIYTNKWQNEWGPSSEGYNDYFQDSKGWLKGGYIDAIMPMIYASGGDCGENDKFWTRDKWETLVRDFQADSSGRFVFPGIGAKYCNFEEIAWRINKGREIGVAGHAIFSYSYLNSKQYFDDLQSGPYAKRATIPDIGWH